MDIAGLWRSLHPDPADVPRPGAVVQTPDEGITISVTQQCQIALPLSSSRWWGFNPSEISVTVTSNRPGVAAQVEVEANFNSADFSYQGTPTTVGRGQFAAGSPHVYVGFVVMRPAGWPVIGVGATATWQDGAPLSAALTYLEIECLPGVLSQWLLRVLAVGTGAFPG